jgi:pimeloyl-ACP methyl ester carboxylesterase
MLICERSMSWHGDAWRWRTDPSLNWRSPALMTEEQVLDVLRHIEAPTLSIFCNRIKGWIDRETVDARIAAVADGRFQEIEGHHHFHMDQPALTARLIIGFLNSAEPKDARKA